MGDIKIKLDISQLDKLMKEYAMEIEQDLQAGIKNLAAQTHGRVSEMASQELKSTSAMFRKNLTWGEIAPDVYAVTIKEPAVWIDDGIKPNTDMKPGLLKDAEISAKGHRYKIIPFDQGKGPSSLTPMGKVDLQDLKQVLKENKINFKTLELNKDGSPKLGKVASLDLGGRIPGKGKTPIFDRVNIYQVKNEQTGKVSRKITTFRTVTDGPSGQGKFIHPGFTAKDFLGRAATWAEQVWENQILPEIFKKWSD